MFVAIAKTSRNFERNKKWSYDSSACNPISVYSSCFLLNKFIKDIELINELSSYIGAI
jgi:hypothetical protein